MTFRRLDWDSSFFGVDVHQYVPSASGELQTATIPRGLVQCLLPADDRGVVPSLLAAGFERADERVTLERRVASDSVSDASMNLVRFTAAEIPALQEMTADMFAFSRYRAVKVLPDGAANALYREWIKNAVLGTFDDECVGFADSTGPIAFCALKYDPPARSARIGLFGVHPRGQGRGLAGTLLAAVFARLAARGVASVSVSTQRSNTGALRAYERAGFAETRSDLWFHHSS